MRRALLAAGAVLIMAAPAFAESSSVTIEKRSVTTERTVPEVGSTVTTTIIAPTPPPAPQAETPPPPPGPGVAWIPGHWAWEQAQTNYTWVHGRYAEPPRAHAAWVAGHWVPQAHGWIWEEGHWD